MHSTPPPPSVRPRAPSLYEASRKQAFEEAAAKAKELAERLAA
ncbi:hypothetical protein [Streptomyces sp. NPDC050988]